MNYLTRVIVTSGFYQGCHGHIESSMLGLIFLVRLTRDRTIDTRNTMFGTTLATVWRWQMYPSAKQD